MNARHMLLFALLVICGVARAAEDASPRQTAKAKVEELNNALIKEDFGKVADLTHAKVVEMMGGREKMMATMQAGLKDMKAQGYAFTSVKVEDATEPVPVGSDLYVAVPFTLEMKAQGGKLLQKSFVVGVSSDHGKSWTFVNGDFDIKQMKQVLPNLPDQLKLPAKQKPEIKKD